MQKRREEEKEPPRKKVAIDWTQPLLNHATRAIQREDGAMLLRVLCRARLTPLGLQNFILNDLIPLFPPNLDILHLAADICIEPTYADVARLCGYTLKTHSEKSPLLSISEKKRDLTLHEIERERDRLVAALREKNLPAALHCVGVFRQCTVRADEPFEMIADVPEAFVPFLAASGYYIREMRDVWHAVFSVVKDMPRLFTLFILLCEHPNPNIVMIAVRALCSNKTVAWTSLNNADVYLTSTQWPVYEPEGLPMIYGAK